MRTIGTALSIVLLSSGHAFAHGTAAAAPAWTFDPWIVIPLFASGSLYGAGALILHRRSHIRPRARSLAHIGFLCGWLSLAGALISPLHGLGEQLFTFHMIEHEIIMAVSAPLLVLARPIGTLLWSLPRRLRLVAARWLRSRSIRAAWDWASGGLNATILHGIAIWVWHAPGLFDAAVTNLAMHRLQHLSFLVTAILFWWSVFHRSEAGAGAWHLFLTMMHTSALGALMALAPRVLYTVQTAAAPSFGLTALEDQQLAGIVMWVPAGTIYAGAALALLAIWISGSSAKTEGAHAARAV
jgi:cytochrome c oxidase assembly factor CtaG